MARITNLVTVIVFTLSSLSCGLVRVPGSGSDRIVTRTRLPTLTPTPRLTLTLTPLPISMSSITETAINDVPSTQTLIPVANPSTSPQEADPSSATAASTSPVPPTLTTTPEPSPTLTPLASPTATSTPQTGGWSFTNVRTIYMDEYQALFLYGDLTNDTGQTQKLTTISGTFYDAQGQLIADQNSITLYWPLDVVPPGGRIPFELTIEDIQDAANFELWADSEVNDNPPRQDFDLTELGQREEEDVYCLEGELRNPGHELKEYLAIIATFYDSQGFSEDYAPDPEGIVGDEAYYFEICIDLPGQDFSHYELQAWGL